ncbi:MAG: hypothetical protein AB7N71_03865 [Phycisphaerae bacterium]
MKSIVLFTAACGVLALGCRSANSRLNAPPHGAQAEGPPDLQGTYVYMADNALLESMEVSDYHFLPHRDILTTLGKQRLNRLASLIEEYGGTIRFNTTLADDILVQNRTQSIIEYLQEIGVDTGTTMVSRESYEDTGTHAADEAILIKVMEGTYRPRRNSGGNSGANSGGNNPVGSTGGGSYSGN